MSKASRTDKIDIIKEGMLSDFWKLIKEYLEEQKNLTKDFLCVTTEDWRYWQGVHAGITRATEAPATLITRFEEE